MIIRPASCADVAEDTANRPSFIFWNEEFGLPMVFFSILPKHNFGFHFLIDTSVRRNLMDWTFSEEWVNEMPRYMESKAHPPYEFLRREKVICKDGREKVCPVFLFFFTLKDGMGRSQRCCEPFATDKSLGRYFNISKEEKLVAGVLGTDFLKKHKWILDFNS